MVTLFFSVTVGTYGGGKEWHDEGGQVPLQVIGTAGSLDYFFSEKIIKATFTKNWNDYF